MSTAGIVSYYTGLLAMQYKSKPNASALLTALVTPAVLDQLPLLVQAAYGVTTAVGPQLDVIAKYVGANRNGFGALGQPITLVDSDLVLLIQLCIVKNASGSSLGTIEQLLNFYFGNKLIVSDSANMSLVYTLASTFGSSDLRSLIVGDANNQNNNTGGSYLPKPMGVGISAIILPPGNPIFFTFCTYTANAPAGTCGFNDYVFFNSNYIWFTYQD